LFRVEGGWEEWIGKEDSEGGEKIVEEGSVMK
jgi:hypothetical protein